MGYVRALVMPPVSVRRHMSRDVFRSRSDMFTGLVTRPISRRFQYRIMRSQTFVIRGGMRFIGFTSCRSLEEFFLSPERHGHKTRHVKRRAGGGDSANQPDEPA